MNKTEDLKAVYTFCQRPEGATSAELQQRFPDWDTREVSRVVGRLMDRKMMRAETTKRRNRYFAGPLTYDAQDTKRRIEVRNNFEQNNHKNRKPKFQQVIGPSITIAKTPEPRFYSADPPKRMGPIGHYEGDSAIARKYGNDKLTGQGGA